MATLLEKFHGSLRRLLGDEKIEEMWAYSSEVLDSAVRAVFAQNSQPDGYVLQTNAGVAVTASTLDKADRISPDVPLGVPFAKILLEAALICINGEDGASKIVTRTATEQDWGDRKRSLESSFSARLRELATGTIDAQGWLEVTEEN
jgi:hypothetical protein